MTHALKGSSAAINAGDANTYPDYDQRGEDRDTRCDVGAFEFISEDNFIVIPLKDGKTVVVPAG